MQCTDRRDAQLILRLIRDHDRYLRSYARRLCRSRADADDLIQDVFEKLMASPIPPGANERAWASRVMRNAFVDMLRRQRVRLSGDQALQPHAQDECAWWQQLDENHVRAYLGLLPDCQRTAFELFAFDGSDYGVIAAQLGVTKATVGTRIFRARRKLRTMLVAAHGPGG